MYLELRGDAIVCNHNSIDRIDMCMFVSRGGHQKQQKIIRMTVSNGGYFLSDICGINRMICALNLRL